MKFLEFQKKMHRYPLFAIHDLRLIFPLENVHTLNTELSQWAHQQKIVKLKNGLYVLSPEYTKYDLSPEVIAAKLYGPSYVSLEYALATYGIIPEAVFEITSVTTKATRTFHTPYGAFQYRTMKSSCFFGFRAEKREQFPYYIASPEKAVIDFLYLNSHRLSAKFQTWDDLRFQSLETLNLATLKKIAKKFNNKKLISLTHNLIEYAASA